MEEQLISFETAKLAKEKGFNERLEYSYFNLEEGHRLNGDLSKRNFHIPFGYSNNTEDESRVSAPTQSLLQKWLRDIHNVDCEAQTFIDKDGVKKYESYVFSDKYKEEYNSEDIGDDDSAIFLTYEEALEDSLYGALKDI